VIHSILAVYFFKGTSPRTVTGRERGINISGVDFWHAVEFSRNGRFLRTHPHGLSSGRFPSVLLCSFFVLAFPTLPDRFRIRFPVGWVCLLAPRFPSRPFDIHYVNRSARQLIIEFREFELRHAGTPNSSSLRGSRR
jgi:hypothetical protein